ncbi:MAG: glycine zipper 2TM domain-containing protein [Acidovorax sp.]|uniref:glycine zipper 2TM domain-containing protein n=1 Tax=Acidovorax sp. TaxID=1872122 RepID=UPI00260F9ABC|nr:glycine zipper 2TM domain-containing protein [Acidovorax sp.]MDH4415847.1 glycine zipper 2TM domain-containing protein [Acidovorax sp.]
MKKIVIFSAMAAAATLATAQEQGRVLSATPIVQQVGLPQQVCGNETVYSGNRTSGAGAVMGAIAGGAAGNAIGKGSGRAAATAIGVIGGAVLGNQIEGGQPQYQNVQRCTTETYYENRTVGYNVVYEYAGRQYTTRTQNDPGRWIPLSVQPTGQTYSTQPDPYAHQGVYSQPGVVTSTYPVQPVYQQPTYVTPPVTVIEYGYDRPYYPHHRNPYWR